MDDVTMPIVDLGARAGRTGHRLRVTEAKRLRAASRHLLGTSNADTPSVTELLKAAANISRMLDDASEGELCLKVELGITGEFPSPSTTLATLETES